MSPVAQRSLVAAAACATALVLCAVVALGVEAGRARDGAILHAFMTLNGPRVDALGDRIVRLGDPGPYMVAGLALVAAALARGRAARAAFVVVLLAGTAMTTRMGQELLSAPRYEPWMDHPIGANAWPSGHATAAMALALCAVLVAPARLRLLAALVGGAFAAAMGYSLIVLGWHYPSDVVAGYLVSGLWTALAFPILGFLERRPDRARPERLLQVGVASLAAFAFMAMTALAALAVVGLVRNETALDPLERPLVATAAVVIAALAAALPVTLSRE